MEAIKRPTGVTSEIAFQVPSMAYEISDISVNGILRLPKVTKNVEVTVQKDKLLYQYTPTPYIFTYSLYIMVKNLSDLHQILEQIIPFFNPDYTISLNLIPELNIRKDIPVVLEGTSFEDTYEGGFEDRRTIIATMTFSMKVDLYGIVNITKPITRTQVDFYAVSGGGELTAEEMADTARSSRYVLMPGLTANGQPTSNAALSIDRSLIRADDPYGLIEDYYFFSDSKRYNPATGEDVEITHDNDS